MKIIQKYWKRLDGYTKDTAKKSFHSIIVKIGGTAFGLILSIMLGRLLGPDGLGVINLANRITEALLVICILGTQKIIAKEIAIAKDQENEDHIGDIIKTASLMVGGLTTVVAAVSIILSPWIATRIFKTPQLSFPLMVFFFAMISQSFIRIYSSALVGYGKLWQRHALGQTLSTVITCAIVFFLWRLEGTAHLNEVVLAYAAGRIMASLSNWTYWRHLYPNKRRHTFIGHHLMQSALPLLTTSIVGFLRQNTDVLILGLFLSPHQIGLYAVASRIALLPSVLLEVIGAAMSANAAALFAAGKFKDLEKMSRHIGLGWIFMLGLPTVVLILAGPLILNIWGADFKNAYPILIILGTGQLIFYFCGPISTLMPLCGFEKFQSKLSIVMLIFHCITIITLVKTYGVNGAAIATVLTSLIGTIASVYHFHANTGILTLPITFKPKA